MKVQFVTGVCLAALASSGHAQAQGSPPAATQAESQPSADTGLAEIVVTAQRRSENLQSVPISVSATTSAQLEAAGINSMLDISKTTPGLQIQQASGNLKLSIHGIGSNSVGPGNENPTALYIDGVYIASAAGSFLNFANIERVEVLKGPQGTLFGRNATGGLVQVITSDPKHDFAGSLDVGYGNYQTGTINFYMTGGVSETLAADMAIYYSNQGKGYGKNLNTGNDVYRNDDDLSMRSKLLWEPAEGTRFVLSGDYSYKKSSMILSQNVLPDKKFSAFYSTLPGYGADLGGFYDINQTDDPRALMKSWGTSLEATQDLGFAQLKSITAYRATKFHENFDLDNHPKPFVGFKNGLGYWKQFSQELQLSSQSNGPLKWTVGAYYFHSKDGWDPADVYFGLDGTTVLFGIPGATSIDLVTINHQTTDSYAGYGQATWEFLPATRLTLGGRYTSETRKVDGVDEFYINNFLISSTPFPTPGFGIPDRLKFNNFSYRVALDHSITDNILAYASYSTGFKSGGYNLLVGQNPPVKPEKIRAAEIGLKTELFDRRLRFNVSAFQYKYRNIQVGSFTGNSQIIYNGAAAKIKGIDVETEARVTSGLTLSGGFSYLHARFTSFPSADFTYSVPDCDFTNPSPSRFCQASAAGNALANSPTFSGNVGFSWENRVADGALIISGNLYHTSRYFATVDNNPDVVQKSYDVLNGSVSWSPDSKAYKITIWGKNLLDKKYSDITLIYTGGITHAAAPPLTYGATVGFKF